MPAARTPGKLILSGEHAVVHGSPAIAVAVNRYADVFFEPEPGSDLWIHFGDAPPRRFALAELGGLRRAAEERHAAGSHAPPTHEELIAIACSHAGLSGGGRLRIACTIPVGAGMGSSAAVLLGTLRVLQDDNAPLYPQALACEHLQHGRSSGLDPFTCLHGGCVEAQNGTFRPLSLPSFPTFHVLDSGRPVCSTGECVREVGTRHGADARLWTDFAAVTRDFRHALFSGDTGRLLDAVRANHRLLVHIGVVPPPVQALVRQIESTGAAAKVCGAGAVRGDGAGMVAVFGPKPPSLPGLFTVHPDLNGCTRLP